MISEAEKEAAKKINRLIMQHKILSLLSFLLIFTIQGISQNNMRFGILAGANLQTITGKDFEGKKLENDMIRWFSRRTQCANSTRTTILPSTRFDVFYQR
jgi:hypothetical protein